MTIRSLVQRPRLRGRSRLRLHQALSRQSTPRPSPLAGLPPSWPRQPLVLAFTLAQAHRRSPLPKDRCTCVRTVPAPAPAFMSTRMVQQPGLQSPRPVNETICLFVCGPGGETPRQQGRWADRKRTGGLQRRNGQQSKATRAKPQDSSRQGPESVILCANVWRSSQGQWPGRTGKSIT